MFYLYLKKRDKIPLQCNMRLKLKIMLTDINGCL